MQGGGLGWPLMQGVGGICHRMAFGQKARSGWSEGGKVGWQVAAYTWSGRGLGHGVKWQGSGQEERVCYFPHQYLLGSTPRRLCVSGTWLHVERDVSSCRGLSCLQLTAVCEEHMCTRRAK